MLLVLSLQLQLQLQSLMRSWKRMNRKWSSKILYRLPIPRRYGRLTRISREWREKQEEAIKARDAASKDKRQETIAKAERAIDGFYEEYAHKKERNIRENK